MGFSLVWLFEGDPSTDGATWVASIDVSPGTGRFARCLRDPGVTLRVAYLVLVEEDSVGRAVEASEKTVTCAPSSRGSAGSHP